MGKRRSESSKSILALGISFLTIGCLLAGTSLAWLCPPQTNASLSGIEGEATGSYFESGNGTSDDPYIIANPKQLYYFSWLQDLGRFNNKKKDSSGSESSNYEQVYFKLAPKDGTKTLDMTGYRLPPAGTEDYPFIGNFDGNGVAINNLAISNAKDKLTDYPNGASFDNSILSGAEIVGFFGIVGQYETDISYETSTNAVKDLYFDNLTVESGASKVLAGFIAGYANGTIDNCGIHCGQFSFAEGAAGLTNGEAISKYAIFGDYGSNLNWTNKPESGSGDSGNNWGSSISFLDINRRINYIATESTENAVSSYARYYFSNDGYHLYFTAGNKANEFNYQTTYRKYIGYICEGTYLPLSIDTDMAYEGGEIEGTNTYNDGAAKMHTTAFYKNHSSEDSIVKNNNSGYLVGGGGLSAAGKTGDLRTYIAQISLIAGNDKSLPAGTTAYDGDKATIYTIDSRSGSTSTEITKSNYASFGYTKYESVIDAFNTSMNGKTTIHGFHMLQVDENSSSNYLTVTNGNIKINGKSYDNYQFLKTALNFTVAKKGYITALISGTFGSSNTNFDLFKVERDASKNIQSITRIKKIYKNNSSNGDSDSYLYDPDDSDSSKGDLLFNFENTVGNTSTLTSNCIYYFEVPVNPGDYIIGKSNSTDKNMGYLMYLDIGANAGKSDEGDKTVKATNIDFVYEDSNAANGLAKINAENYVSSGVVFSISGSPTSAAKLLYFKRDSSGNEQGADVGVIYYTECGCAITPAGNGASTNKDPSSKEENSA